MLLEDLVHSEMYPLDNVPAVVEDPANIFRVHGAGEVGVAVVGAVLLRVPARGLLRDLKEVVPDKVFCSREFSIRPLVYFRSSLRGEHVMDKFGKIFF